MSAAAVNPDPLHAAPAPARTYVLVTPVRNEEATLAITLESVINQTWRPAEWVIVDDGSIDRTAEILDSFARNHAFIKVLTLAARPKRSFSSVVFATEAGVAHLSSHSHEFIGLLDADIRFGHTYYAEMIRRFDADPALGLAGGLVVDCVAGRRLRVSKTLHDVAGAVQFFRRSCFESLGGLIALPEGGWDALTCVQARLQGFRTQTFDDIEVDHLKPRNIAQGNVFRRHFFFGMRDYALGSHIVFETLKCGHRALGRPFMLGGVARLCGYCWCWLSRRPRDLSAALLAQIRREQISRLRLSVRARLVQQPHHPAPSLSPASSSPPTPFDAVP